MKESIKNMLKTGYAVSIYALKMLIAKGKNGPGSVFNRILSVIVIEIALKNGLH